MEIWPKKCLTSYKDTLPYSFGSSVLLSHSKFYQKFLRRFVFFMMLVDAWYLSIVILLLDNYRLNPKERRVEVKTRMSKFLTKVLQLPQLKKRTRN